MAFRSETKIGTRAGAAGILLVSFLIQHPALAQQGEWQVRHQHLRNGAMGKLRVTPDSIEFEERDGKGRATAHSRQWKYEDIQLLTLGTKSLHILTYEDQRWNHFLSRGQPARAVCGLGCDREFVFDRIPPEMVSQLYTAWRDRLDARFVAALADGQAHAEWQMPVKLVRGHRGSQGVLRFGADRIVYETAKGEESRTWRIHDIENVSSSGTFDLTITAHEREFRFELKEALAEDRYNRLWRQINVAGGLRTLTAGN